MKRNISLILIVVLMSVFVLSGCSGTNKEAEVPETGETETGETEQEATEEEKLVLGYTSPIPEEYVNSMLVGMNAWIDEHPEVEVLYQSMTENSQSNENEVAEALAAKGAKGIIIAPRDPAGSNTLMQELKDQGIATIANGAQPEMPTTADFVLVTDVYQAAYDSCEFLIKEMGEKGKILNCLQNMSDANTTLRNQAIEECVSKYPDVEIYQTIGDMMTVEEANEKITNALGAGASEIDGIICTGGEPSMAMVQAVRSYYEMNGTEKQFKCVGIDTYTEVLDGIRDGIVSSTIAQNPFGQGYLALEILKLMCGEGYVPIESGVVVDTGTFLVTKDNLDTWESDFAAVTEQISSELTTKYLKKP